MRQLYQCLNARVDIDQIYCKAGHSLGKTGTILYECAERGDQLVCQSCEKCPDFDKMGKPLSKEDRGWK